MSLSKSLLRAAKIQEKIDELRSQLSGLLDQARAELAATPVEEFATPARHGKSKLLKRARNGVAKGTKKVRRPVEKKPVRREGTNGRSKPVRMLRAGRRSPLAGQKRAASPTGPLSPAVIKVLQARKQPMNVRDILDGLLSNGYQFNSAEPKKNLAARIYRLKGVKQVSAGLFGLV